MPDIKHRVAITAPIQKVYDAVATSEGVSSWWSRDGVQGKSEVGERLQICFGSPEPAAIMQITQLQPPHLVTWNCVEGPDE